MADEVKKYTVIGELIGGQDIGQFLADEHSLAAVVDKVLNLTGVARAVVYRDWL